MLGAWFSPLLWNASLLGLYRATIRDEYPQYEDAVPVVGGVGVALFPAPQRGLYFSEKRDVLVQLQQTMFYLNWRRLGPDEPYPRFEPQRDRFIREWERLQGFLAREKVPLPIVGACQVSYVNHIEIPDGETQGEVLARILSGASPRLLVDARQFNFTGVYVTESGTELNVQAIPALRASDNRSTVQFTLTANCSPKGGEVGALVTALDQAHDDLINSFLRLTSDEAREGWGQQ
jgi:uncharacterized protein (TIGR04255 family)